MASQCCDRTSSFSSSFSSPSSCFSAAQRGGTAVSTALQQFDSSVRYSQQLACELETTKETAVEEKDHDDPLVFTISQPKTELRTRPPAPGRHNCSQPVAPRGRFYDTAVATTRDRRDSEPKMLLLSFGSSDGWSEASKLQKTMATKKHSAEGFCKENAMEKSESKETYVSSTLSSEANWTIQMANPRPQLIPLSTAALAPLFCKSPNDQGNPLCNISLNDFITRVTIPPPPPPTSPSLVAAETRMYAPMPPPLPDFAGRRLGFRSEKTTDRFIRSVEPTIPKDRKYGGVSSPPLKPRDDGVQLSPLTIQRIQSEDGTMNRGGATHQLNLYGPMSENDAVYISLEEDFAKLVTPPPPARQNTKNGVEIQRPAVPPPPPPPVSVAVNYPLLLTLPPHPPPNRSSGRGHTLAAPLFSNSRRPHSATTPSASQKLSAGEAMNGFDGTRLSHPSAPRFSQRNVDESSIGKTKDAKETTIATTVALSLSHESLSKVAARDETNSLSAVTKQQTHSRTHNNAATLPRTAPPTPPRRLNSAIDSNSVMDKRRNRRVSFEECPLQIDDPGRRDSCSPSNIRRSSRRESCSPPSSNHEESGTRKSRRNETNLPQSSSLSRLINAATSWVGCRQPPSQATAQIRPHAIRSSSSSAFQSIVQDNEPSGALVAEAAAVDSSRKVRSGSFGGASASANVSVFSNFKSKLRSYWSPSMSKRKSFVQGSSTDQSSDVVSSSSSKRSSSIDVTDYAQETPDGNPKTIVSPRRRSSSRSRMEAIVKVTSIVGTPVAAEEDDAHLEHSASLKQNAPNTFNTFTGRMPIR